MKLVSTTNDYHPRKAPFLPSLHQDRVDQPPLLAATSVRPPPPAAAADPPLSSPVRRRRQLPPPPTPSLSSLVRRRRAADHRPPPSLLPPRAKMGAAHLPGLSWGLFAAAAVLVVLRITTQRLLPGPSSSPPGALAKVHADDWLMSLAVVALLGVVMTANQVATHGSNYFPDAESVAGWTDVQKQRAVWGSKMSLVLEESFLVALFLVKACMLLLYRRMA